MAGGIIDAIAEYFASKGSLKRSNIGNCMLMIERLEGRIDDLEAANKDLHSTIYKLQEARREEGEQSLREYADLRAEMVSLRERNKALTHVIEDLEKEIKVLESRVNGDNYES